MSRFRLSPATPSALTLTRAASTVAIVLLAFSPASSTAARLGIGALLCVQFGGVAWVYLGAARRVTGTRYALFMSLGVAFAFACLGRLDWVAHELLTGRAPSPPLVAVYAGIAFQLSAMAGLAAALGRYRHRNWMRFEAMVDALLLIVAAAIVIVQLDAMPGGDAPVQPGWHAVFLIWNTLAAGNLILITLLLVWRGESLGPRLAAGLALTAMSLGPADVLYARDALLDGAPLPRLVGLLWSLAALFALYAVHQPRLQAEAVSVESPAYASNTAKVRTVSIVVAILIGTWSAASLSFRGARSTPLGVALVVFGLLLAVRAGYALWTQQRTTRALEHAAIAERAQSALLERRVAERTSELAEAHRVMQRMWALGQQIALELTPERVLQRFIEAAMDVLRVDGGAVGLATADSVQVAITAGLGAPLAGKTFPITGSAMGRVVRTAEAWWIADAAADSAEEDIPVADGVRAVVVIPLQRRGECIGAISLMASREREFSDSEVSHVEAMADLLSVALANADLLETLRKAEWRFRTLFRVAPDAVLTTFNSGRIREANDAVHEILGLHPVRVVGRTLDEFVVEEDRERLRQEMQRVLDGQPSRMELRMKHEAGVRIVSLAARRLPEAEPPMVLFLGRDMTAEREMRARLAETERLAAVGELVAGVAHEVNNPLCTISAFAQLLERDGNLTAEQRESVEVISSETIRASQVLRDLLTFARRSESESATIQLNELVERTLRLRGYELGRFGITADIQLATDLPLVSGDPRQLQQVLLNLIMNAIQAMEGMGRGTLRIATRADGDLVILDVTDTGPGIPDESRKHIFEPFFTTKHDGTGLGLSVSYGIVAAHGGMITIPQCGPEGTTFRISLPSLPELGASAEQPEERSQPTSSLAGVRMLFVDDEVALHAGIRSYARKRGFHVVAVPDGAAALAAARRERFDVVVCDLRMRGVDGPAFFEILRREHPALAVRTLFITGDLVSVASRTFLETVGQPVLAKPFDLDQLEIAVAAVLRDSEAREGATAAAS
jgi:two-component system NtrC family sensor kinase